jgi:hypothetical protein
LRRALVRSRSTGDTELVDFALEENARLSADVDALRKVVAEREDEVENLQLEIESLQEELNRQAETFALVARSTRAETAPSADEELPANVESIAEAVALAQRLDGVVVPEDAARDIDTLDSTVTAGAWAKATWRGLRAFDEYVRDRDRVSGGFWEWCANSQSPRAWPATSKKLSMSESEAVMNNQKTHDQRVLPVDEKVDSSGKILMVAHLKIAEGGGPLAPRVYFYDDTRGPTGKVHVGFIGPHHHMQNTKTN